MLGVAFSLQFTILDTIRKMGASPPQENSSPGLHLLSFPCSASGPTIGAHTLAGHMMGKEGYREPIRVEWQL